MRKRAGILMVMYFWLTLTKVDGLKIRVNFNYISTYRIETVVINEPGKKPIVSSCTVLFYPDVRYSIKVQETPEQIDAMLINYTPISSFNPKVQPKP
jgi:hypothetical protein